MRWGHNVPCLYNRGNRWLSPITSNEEMKHKEKGNICTVTPPFRRQLAVNRISDAYKMPCRMSSKMIPRFSGEREWSDLIGN